MYELEITKHIENRAIVSKTFEGKILIDTIRNFYIKNMIFKLSEIVIEFIFIYI